MANSILLNRGSASVNRGAGIHDTKLSDLLCSHNESGFWNRSCLDKQLVFKRKSNHVCNNIANDVLKELHETKNDCSLEQAGRCLVGMYSTNTLEEKVIKKICNKVQHKVMPAIEKLMESKFHDRTSVGYMAEHLTFLWRLYKALKFCNGTSFHIKEIYLQPCHLIYLFDRLTFLTALWRQRDYMYCMKSVLTEWLISETPKSHKGFVSIPYSRILTKGLDDINIFMVDFIKFFTVNETSRKKIASLISHSKGTVKQGSFVNWLVFTMCFLNLNHQVSDKTAKEIVCSENLEEWLLYNVQRLLERGFNEGITLEKKVNYISDGLQILGNKLIRIELNEECEDTIKVPSAVLVDYQTWENQESVLEYLFAEDDGKKKKKEKEKKKAGVSSKKKRKMLERDNDFEELRGISKKLDVMASNVLGGQASSSSSKMKEGVIQWEKMKTDFPLDNVDDLTNKKGKEM